jgi:3-oxoacyl-[acyl-carrier protein] reductase
LRTRLSDEIAAAIPLHSDEAADVDAADLLGPPARLAVFLGSSASDGISGKLISARWDPWSSLADLKHELAESDVYTLRRIVPADRSFDPTLPADRS